MIGRVIQYFLFSTFLKRSNENVAKRHCREVLTLHLLTITLRRNLNPPGYF